MEDDPFEGLEPADDQPPAPDPFEGLELVGSPAQERPPASGYASRGIAGTPTGLGRPGSTDQPDSSPLASSLQENVVEPVSDALTAAQASAGRMFREAMPEASKWSADITGRTPERSDSMLALARERSPTAATIGELAPGMAVPQTKAGGALGFLTNVGTDTAIGYSEGGQEGAENAGAVSLGLRSVPLVGPALSSLGRKAAAPVAKAATRGLAKGRTLGVDENTAAAAEKALDPGPVGQEFRAAARRGEAGVEAATRDITDAISKAERHADAILDAGGVGMKRAPIANHIAAEGVDSAQALRATEDTIEDVWTQVESLQQSAEGSGKTALRALLGNNKDPGDIGRAIEAFGVNASADPDGAANAFVILDHLKRRIGRAVRRSGRGAAPDHNTQDALKGLYETVRQALENEEVWGAGATQIQREVNRAWVPFIRKSRGLQKMAETDIRGLQGADPWDVIFEGDPAKIHAILQNAGHVTNEVTEKALIEALEATEGISGALAKHYNIPPDVAAGAGEVSSSVGRVRDSLGQTIADMSAARELRAVEQAATEPIGGVLAHALPDPAKTARVMGKGEAIAAGRKPRQPMDPDAPLLRLARTAPRAAAITSALEDEERL